MAVDPELAAETRGWLAKAAEDLGAGELEFGATPPFLSDIAFHSQQAAEKAVKAFLTWNSAPFRRTHSLEELGEQCLALDETLQSLIDRAVPLTEYAWKFRCPGEPVSPTRTEARDALDIAREVYEAVLARLPVEAHPS